MINLEVRLKIYGREVSLDAFTEEFAERVAKAIGGEIERRFGWLLLPGVRETIAIESQEKRKEAKAVGIAEAAHLLGVSPYTIRLYISQGKIHAVHFGRRVLVPMESIQKVLKEGVARGRTK